MSSLLHFTKVYFPSRAVIDALECVLVQALAKTRKVVHSPILRRITRCEKWLKEDQAGGLERLEAREGWRSRLEGVPGTLLKVMR